MKDVQNKLTQKSAFTSCLSGGVPLLWKNTINDFVSRLAHIDFDRIAGIRCDFSDNDPLFMLGVYLPASSHNIEEFNQYLDYFWTLYEALPTIGQVFILSDLNSDPGNSLGERERYDPNERVLKPVEFANCFNLCHVNLLDTCSWNLGTYVSHCEDTF